MSSLGVTLQGDPDAPENLPCFRVCVDGEPTGSELFLLGRWLDCETTSEPTTREPIPAPAVADGDWVLTVVACDRVYHSTTFASQASLSEFREFLADEEDAWRELHMANRRGDREAAYGIAHRFTGG